MLPSLGLGGLVGGLVAPIQVFRLLLQPRPVNGHLFLERKTIWKTDMQFTPMAASSLQPWRQRDVMGARSPQKCFCLVLHQWELPTADDRLLVFLFYPLILSISSLNILASGLISIIIPLNVSHDLLLGILNEVQICSCIHYWKSTGAYRASWPSPVLSGSFRCNTLCSISCYHPGFLRCHFPTLDILSSSCMSLFIIVSLLEMLSQSFFSNPIHFFFSGSTEISNAQ